MTNERPEPPMTGLERELLGCVERLTTASIDSAAAFAALERRSSERLTKRLAALEACLPLLISSQSALISALNSLASGASTYADAQKRLAESRQTLTNAEAMWKARSGG